MRDGSAAEPFVVAALGHTQPDRFDPARYAAGEPPAAFYFGGVPRAEPSAGDAFSRSIAKVAFVQMRRMFEDVRLSAGPPAPTAGGFPLRSLPEGTEVLLKPKMYYELQRGVKKLRF